MKKNKQYSQIPFEAKTVNKAEYTLEGVFSTSDMDRHGDIVEQNWDLEKYRQNPVVLNNHQSHDATETIGRMENIQVIDGKLQGKIKFAVNENPKAKVIFDLYAGKFLSAFSAGFIPLEFGTRGEIKKSELLEVSAVSVPANAMALAKSAGIDIGLLENKSEDKTDFPEKGDNKKVSLSNSKYRQFDYSYAQDIKDNYPSIWKKGGNIRGNEAFILWGKARKGDDSSSVTDWIKEREAWIARHQGNKLIAGVVAAMKWGTVVSRGMKFMKDMINEEKAKVDEKKKALQEKKDEPNKLKTINNNIKGLCEKLEVETRQKGDRAKAKKIVNKTIRKLLKIKNNI